ncbi:DUF1441 family protein [Helicobacter sp. 13S00482-2]|uniref:DUF1441 family protein n=1 Tax=Helicobacter sp. 13S00482-2 TaxID=1476200 RepID=UPI0021518797|nr:DUF1441 family protein [Helicobacter sp. 13S00482-2]
MTTKELGNIINITPRHIYNLEKSQVFSKEDKDVWVLEKVIPAYIKYKTEGGEGTNLAKSREKKEKYEAELKRLEYLKRMGQLIPIEGVAKELEDIAITVSNKLYSIPPKLKSRYQLDSKIESIIIKEIEDVLKELKDPSIYDKQAQEIAKKIELEKTLQKEMSEDESRATSSNNQGQDDK